MKKLTPAQVLRMVLGKHHHDVKAACERDGHLLTDVFADVEPNIVRLAEQCEKMYVRGILASFGGKRRAPQEYRPIVRFIHHR